MISYKRFIEEKFKMKKNIKDILYELDHDKYYLNMNSNLYDKTAIHLKWFGERACIMIHEFKNIFEERFGNKYYLDPKDSDIENIEFFIIRN